ncbi:SAM-dependent methyltransferase [Paractinoplanes brasiliensis]|uniref:SAM-dependent methyltransferase n=1 Tax=Paractinoplanes brasiliensis TaxID=52695 RepID=UPI00105EE3B4
MLGVRTGPAFAAPGAPARPHRRPCTPAEVSRSFTGLELREPGIVSVQDWRPEPDRG